MKESERQEILEILDWEGGYEYLVGGSDFKDITKDKKFHALRKAYIKASQDLSAYLGEL